MADSAVAPNIRTFQSYCSPVCLTCRLVSWPWLMHTLPKATVLSLFLLRPFKGVMIALAPTQLAPAATGSARVFTEEAGLRIELVATGLPRRDGVEQPGCALL